VIRDYGVTTLWLTASLFNTLITDAPEVLAPVQELLTGGEALSVPHIRRAQAQLPHTQLINGYGPTESTTFTCCYRIPRSPARRLHQDPHRLPHQPHPGLHFGRAAAAAVPPDSRESSISVAMASPRGI
jgi:non-ribosomal peptide synthetase component F